jgi:hypothetical protein
MSDSLLQAIIGGNPLDLPGLGPKDKGLTILFPLSLGGTVNDLAHALHLPVESILAVNPGLRADSSLGVSQVVDLPEGHIDRIMQSVNVTGGRAYVSAPLSDMPPTSSVPSDRYAVQVSSDKASVSVLPSTLRSTPIAFDALNYPQQDVLFPLPVEQVADRWIVSIHPADLMTSTDKSFNASVAPLSDVAPNQMPIPVSTQASESQTTTTLTASASTIDLSRIIATLATQHQGEREGAFSFTRVANVVVPVAQDRHRNPGSDIPPPPMDSSRFAAPVTRVMSWVGGIQIIPPAAMHAMDLPTDSHPMTLQLMALLLAQSGGSIAAGAVAPSPSQPSPFIDPQALAALAASMRGTKVIDLGAGRNMEFSLVNDRMRRIDPIGEGDRPAFRRTGDGLEEVRVIPPHGEDVEQTDEQREQGRRRRAAIAAMRRRRRPRSRRCRYWRGDRRDLRQSVEKPYPKRVDFAEFRSRQPPRYLWNVGGDPSAVE